MKTLTNSRQLVNFFNETESESIFCLLDIDNFATFNFLNNYEKGDFIITQVSNNIKHIPEFRNLVRFDSDEFLFSCFGNFEMCKNNLFLLMQNIQLELKITVSIGVIEWNPALISFVYILNKLRRGVMTAKELGKNKLYFE